jgi:hypothetical protein
MWNMALNLVEQNYRVLFVTLELSPGQLAIQAAARYSRIEQDRIDEAKRSENPRPFDDREAGAWDTALGKFMAMSTRLRLHGAKDGGRDIRNVIATATKHAYDAVFIDHVGMIGRDSDSEELLILGRSIHTINRLAKGEIRENYRPFVCFSSPLSRDNAKQTKPDEEGTPRLADFRGSSRIDYDTDLAMVVQKRKHPVDVDGCDIVDAFVLKNRYGRCPIVLQFEAQGAIAFVTERRKPDAPPVPFNERSETDE